MINWHSLVEEYYPGLVVLRRRIHRHPELGFQEFATSELIVNTLSSIGLQPVANVAGTGVIALLPGNGPRTVALRTDMDGLPIQEQNLSDYISEVPGVMHACGHDGHIAIALGAAMVLSELQPLLPGNIKFIFQPAEEGPGGAKAMIELGVLKDPYVEAIIGYHLANNQDLGTIGITYGQTCAATDEFRITILGKGGHGAYPHLSVDAIAVGAQIVNALQTIVSRQTNPLDSVVVTVGTFNGGCANNVIADKVEMWGTIRTLSETVRHGIPERIEKLVTGITAANGASYRFVYNQGYPTLINDPSITKIVEAAAIKVVGAENVLNPQPTMGGEDFSFFAQALPAAFFRIGSGTPTFHYPGHHPRFDFDERSIAIGVKTVVQSILDYFGVE